MSVRNPFYWLGVALFFVFVGIFSVFHPTYWGRLSSSIPSVFQQNRDTKPISMDTKKMEFNDAEKDEPNDKNIEVKRQTLPSNQLPVSNRKATAVNGHSPNIEKTERENTVKSDPIKDRMFQKADPSTVRTEKKEAITTLLGKTVHGFQDGLLTEEAVDSDAAIPVSAPEIETMKDSRLKLQAISWSKNPERRIAVINGHIVHEGDPVEEFSVLQINADNVTVASGDNQWKLIFGTR
jgi:hypothetical protein